MFDSKKHFYNGWQPYTSTTGSDSSQWDSLIRMLAIGVYIAAEMKLFLSFLDVYEYRWLFISYFIVTKLISSMLI